MARWKSEDGQALVIVALGMVVLLGFLGLAIDMGSLRLAKRQAQAAADAAALAAAQELSYSDVSSAAQADVQTNFNGATATVASGPCPASSVTALTVIVNHPPSCVSNDPNNGNANYVEVYVSTNIKTPFAGAFGSKSSTITARAEAQGNLNCIYALEPSGIGINAAGAYVTSDCGIVDESDTGSGNAILCGLFGIDCAALDCILGYISAPYIGVVGGTSSFFCGGTTANTGITLPSTPYDPLLYLQSSAPTPTSCGTSTKSPYAGSASPLSISGTATLNAGTYCGGINIAPGAKVTFGAGTFILTTQNPSTKASISGSYGLTVDIGTTVSGTGVTFYNYGPAVSNGGGANNSAAGIVFNFTSFTSGGVSLSAPTSGSYPGILFFQSATNSAPAQILGAFSFNTTLNGAYYFPNAPLTFVFDATTDYDPIVAKSIAFYLSGFSNCPSGSYSYCAGVSHNYPNGVSPLRQGGTALVQ
jgi:Flp pilus assembly protein TadG